ncbi:JNK1/MAPK8-associated membrane protein-like [Rhopilema esculentum]|uniref:JNK1/MAPK8-associated membrane protein-like n=1 Tax=Rhopilema esculentum TaxID=499914 RepID=UPI0031DF1281|eukprot:gene10630-19370_t
MVLKKALRNAGYRTSAFMLLLIYIEPCASSKLVRCPGAYCGRTVDTNSPRNLTDCGKCPRGYRSDGFICHKCASSLTLYDWLYLGFMVLLIPVLNSDFISFFEPKRRSVGFLYLTTAMEAFFAAIIALLVVEPVGSLTLQSCKVESIRDWYTVFFNPKPDYVNEIRCTQEAVYPLYTIVFFYYAICLLLSVTLRQIVLWFLKDISGRKSTYASMYLLPIMLVTHAIFSGVVYYSFPYLILVASSVGNAVYLSKSDELWKEFFRNPESVATLATYTLANAYGIISITQFENPLRDSLLLILTGLPTFFYFVTYRLTDPVKFY